MKISATVRVQNRLLPSLNLVDKRSQKSVLQIGKLSKNEVYVLHQTLQNQVGQKYKVSFKLRIKIIIKLVLNKPVSKLDM